MIFQNSPTLGRFTENVSAVSRSIDARQEEIKAQYERIDELKAMLNEARLQLEYLHEKFNQTGTTEAVLARIDAVLA